MAQGKKSIIVYADWKNVFDQLDDVEAGQLIKHFFNYVNDLNPVSPSKLITIAFEPIKQSLKRDLVKWDGIRERRSEAGKISAEKRKQQVLTSVEINPTKSTSVESVEQDSTKSTVSVNDNVSVNVNDNVNVILLKKETKADLIILNPFQESFRPHWDKWILYKKNEHKATFKRIETQQTAFKHLLELSKNNEDTAVKIIEQSIANQWKGLFELKNLGNGKPEKRSLEQATRDYLAQ